MRMKKDSSREFWKNTPLAEMSRPQWESLCDGCGRCCLHKILFEDTSELAYTSAACRYLDIETCRCTAYGRRSSLAAECLVLTPSNLPRCVHLLPDTCAYRLIAEARDLPGWHPLVSGERESVHRAGISVRGRAVSEDSIDPEDLEEYIIDWINH
jgi:uncharacterized cysteine cluster protein YcgN (CxxCxxCC family)